MVALGKPHRVRDAVRAVHEVAYKIAKKIMVLDVTHIMRLSCDGVRLSGADPAGFSFRLLRSDEVRILAKPENGLTLELADRIDSGSDFCMAALSDDRLAAYGWYALKSIEAAHNRGGALATGVALSFPDEMAFMYKGFTLPEFRGKGLYGRVNARALKELGAWGVTTIISTADWTNWSALKSCWRLGYEDLGLVWRGGWGSYLFTLAPQRAQSIGIQFGRHAVVLPRNQQHATRVESWAAGRLARPE